MLSSTLHQNIKKGNVLRNVCRSVRCMIHNASTIGSFEDIPLTSEKPLPDDQMLHMKDSYTKQLKRYGDIYRNDHDVVFTANPDDFRTIFSDESKAGELQLAMPLWSLSAIAEKFNEPPGLLIMNTKDFFRRKESIKKGMLIPKQVSKLTVLFNEVTLDLMECIETNKQGDVIHDISKYINFWTVETTGMILFREKLGAFSNPLPPDLETIINLNFLDSLYILEMGLHEHRKMESEEWKIFERKTRLLKTATRNLCNKYQERIVDDSYGLTKEEKISTIESIIEASTGTTSEAALSCLVVLSRFPHVQDIIADEVKTVAGDDINLDENSLQKMKYLRATLKELFRIRPVTLHLGRITNTDLVLSNYQVPAKTFVILFHGMVDQAKYLTDAEVFRPERWLKNEENREKVDPLLYAPFGHGARACMGRRLAENTLLLFLANMIRNYKVYQVTKNVEERFNFFFHIRNKQDFRLEKRVSTSGD